MQLISLVTTVISFLTFLDIAFAIKDCLDVTMERCSFRNVEGETIDCNDWTDSEPCEVPITLEYTARNKLHGEEPTTVVIFETRNIDSNINNIERKQGEVFNFFIRDRDVNLCVDTVYTVTIFAKAVDRNNTYDIDLQELCVIVFDDFNLPAPSRNISSVESHEYYEFKCTGDTNGQSKYAKRSSKSIKMDAKERTSQRASSFNVSTSPSINPTTSGNSLDQSLKAFSSSAPSSAFNSSSLLVANTSAPSAVPSVSSNTSKSNSMPSIDITTYQSVIPSHQLNKTANISKENVTIIENSCLVCTELMQKDIEVGSDTNKISLYFSMVIRSESYATGILLGKALLEVLNGIFKAEFLGCNENQNSMLLINDTGLVLADFQYIDINSIKRESCSVFETELKESYCRSAIGEVQVHYVGVRTESEISHKVLQLLEQYTDWISSYIDEVHELHFDEISQSKDSLVGYSSLAPDWGWVIPTVMLSIILLIIAGLIALHFKGKKLWTKLEDDAIRFSDTFYPNSVLLPVEVTKEKYPEDVFSDITDEEND